MGMAEGDSGRKLGVATGDCDGVNTGDFDGELVIVVVGTLDGLMLGLAEGALKPVGDWHQAEF